MGIPVPLECLQAIFQYLQDDIKSLHSILLVDKLWCVNVIPILYKNPFILLNETLFTTPNYNEAFEIHGKNILLLLEIYLSYLTSQQRLEWEGKGIVLSKKVEPLLFDYISYLRILPIPEIQHMILLWCNKDYNIRDNRKFIEMELNKLFLTKCKNINTILFDESTQLPELPESSSSELVNFLPNFHNLNFICTKFSENSILEKIIPFCDEIKVLSILGFGYRTSINTISKIIIPKLITKSKALEKFYWGGDINCDDTFISKSLGKHINSLTHIEIYNNFSNRIINLISKCSNLKKLRFSNNFYNFPQFIINNYDKLIIDITPFTNPNCSFPYLQDLFFGFIPKDPIHFNILLKNTNNSLKELGTIWSNSIHLDTYCENLNFLYLKLSFNDFPQFLNLNNFPSNLTKLILTTSKNPFEYQHDTNEFLIHLGNILPINLKFLHLGMFYRFHSVDSLSKFLSKCQEKLPYPLEFILPFNFKRPSLNDDDGDGDVNSLIKNFVKNHVLSKNSWILFLYFYLKKCKKCYSCHGSLLDEEENPIEPFKEINIIKRCSCYKKHIEPFILQELRDEVSVINVPSPTTNVVDVN